MRTAVGWVLLIALVLLTLFEGLLLALAQFAHDFNTGGPNPPGLQYGWLFFVLEVGALAISRRSGLPLLAVGGAEWIGGVMIFQMRTRHLPLITALGDSWMETSFFLLAAVYVMTTGYRGRRQQHKPGI